MTSSIEQRLQSTGEIVTFPMHEFNMLINLRRKSFLYYRRVVCVRYTTKP